MEKRSFFHRGKSQVRLNLLEDYNQVLTRGDDEFNCQENNDVLSRPPEIGAKQLAANDNLIISQPHETSRPLTASQNRF